MRILIAEDDVANAKFLSKYLSKFGDVVITPLFRIFRDPQV